MATIGMLLPTTGILASLEETLGTLEVQVLQI